MQLTRPGQKTNSPNKGSGEKKRGKSWEGIWLQKQESVKLQCIESSKKTSEPTLTKCRKDELSTAHERMRLDRLQHILNLMKDGMAQNLVFTDEKKIDIQQCLTHQYDGVWSRDGSVKGKRVSQCQKQLSVMVWAAITATGRTSLIFVPWGVKLNSQHYITNIFEAEPLPWACKHFDGAPWTLQQDSALSHGSKINPSWIQAHISAFISKDGWPSRSLDLNSLDFSVWSILKSKVCRTHDSLDNLKLELLENGPWSLQKYCMPPVKLSRVDWNVIKNNGGHIE